VGVLQRLYFDTVYNPLYDATTARFSRYKSLQACCIAALGLAGTQSLLCVGLGTGNELVAALGEAPGLHLTGIDLSASALAASRRKLRAAGSGADLQIMDATALGFPDASFDRVLCMHVLDFLQVPGAAVREMVRVLKPGGRLVATFPSRLEGAALGVSLARDQVRQALRSGRHALAVTAELLTAYTLGLVYVPLLLRGGHHAFSESQVRALFAGLAVGEPRIAEERAYQDLIVSVERTQFQSGSRRNT
jgi:ubiquinone/menaquinone biosynthesis C-methylase UbiE